MKIIAALYGLNKEEITIKNYGNGLINNTWLITNAKPGYILQKINKDVFVKPELIDENIQAINDYLLIHNPGYKLVSPIPSLTGKTIITYDNEYYRMFKFIPSKTYAVAQDASIAFEAAKQFGVFMKNLAGFNADGLYETISHFHDLHLRYSQFLHSIKQGNQQRVQESEKIIQSLQDQKYIVGIYDELLINPSFKKRVTHHDTKISNVLFDEDNKGIAIIDLDTVMPGYYISDVGDMLRTYLSAVSEEETDFDLIGVRDEYFRAIAEGYLNEVKEELSKDEVNAFVYAGKFMIYMQALRFLTDYLNNDVYYAAQYPQHNLNRAENQWHLLKRLTEKEDDYNFIVQNIFRDN